MTAARTASAEASARLDDHHDFLAALDRAFPAIERNHPRQNVNASRKRASSSARPAVLRLDNRGISRIDEDNAFRRFMCHSRSRKPHRVSRARLSAKHKPSMSGSHQFKRVAFVASQTPEAVQARAGARRPLPQYRSGTRRCRRRARRRRVDAANAAQIHGFRQTDLRHAPRHGRLPDERVSARTT